MELMLQYHRQIIEELTLTIQAFFWNWSILEHSNISKRAETIPFQTAGKSQQEFRPQSISSSLSASWCAAWMLQKPSLCNPRVYEWRF